MKIALIQYIRSQQFIIIFKIIRSHKISINVVTGVGSCILSNM